MSALPASAAVPAAPRKARWRGLPYIAFAILGVFLIMALGADFIAPHNPERAALSLRYLPPAWVDGGRAAYFLGTDHLGRDVLSQLIFGARISLIVGGTSVVIAGVLGTAIGIAAGYLGGWFDQVMMRLVDAWLALPSLVFAIFLAAVVGPSETNLVVILAAVYWTRYARVVRSEVLSLRERDFVRLAIVAGASPSRIMARHLLPNVANTAIVLATLMLGSVIVTEASLSFLGVGVPPPRPAWGLMLSDGRKGLMAGYWWLTVFPGLCIMLVVLAASLIGDWLRDRLDPSLRPLS
ncbi:ABC transporter permease [Pigmentiphaga aceris]|uniref:ABC transporter permease n=1 Tax=Pigmentiphaga aceris TaxID=1940612 RepID=A0A5C0B1Y1_9BURK|nr:ABC transporter permease [Pigmentiphaga aceris]QEI06607.1 ABC transporter permease [Pigmentiphaga aceris]